jgi:hypothetical protein
MIFLFFSIEKEYHPSALTAPSLSHLTSGTPTKSNLYLANPLAAVVSDPDLHRLLTFPLPNLFPLRRSYQTISPGSRHRYPFHNKAIF